jgi:hypothetical protein
VTKIDSEAAALQQMTIDSEDEKGLTYSSEEVGRATVHTRQDVILLVSHISALNRQIGSIKIVLLAILLVNGIAVFVK